MHGNTFNPTRPFVLILLWLLLPTSVLAQKATGDIHREMIEWLDVWAPHTNEHKLPRVLLFGDSITKGYYDKVSSALEGKAYVVMVVGSTSLGDPVLMDEMEQILKMYDFDVVHFNNGMHGKAYTDDEYASALPEFYRLIRAHAPHARLIWAQTTAVRVKPDMTEYGPFTERVRQRNMKAAEFFKDRDVTVEDLFEVIGTHPEYYKDGDGTHLNDTGYEVAAKTIAENIEKAIAEGPYDGPSVEWDVQAFSKVPKMTPLPSLDHGNIKAATLSGVDWRGDKTRFFVYYGLPEGADQAHPAPAMVLIHGGGGSAIWDWVRQWNERGYAAIAMANNGQLPVKVEQNPFEGLSERWALLRGGIPLECGDFEHGLRPYDEQWPYVAVANIMLSHSFLRSLPGVDASRIGVTGNSWGGYLTLMSAAVDKRYRFAAPVYGCGFFDEFDILSGNSGPAWQRWLTLWDPCLYIPQIQVPVSWACGTNDFYFSFGALQKSFRLAAIPPYKAVRSPMVHTDGGYEGGMPEETFALADHFLRGGADIPQCGMPVLDSKKRSVSVTYDPKGRSIKSAEMLYLTDTKEPWQEREWKRITLPLPRKGSTIQAKIPQDARILFFNITTQEDLVASSFALTLQDE